MKSRDGLFVLLLQFIVNLYLLKKEKKKEPFINKSTGLMSHLLKKTPPTPLILLWCGKIPKTMGSAFQVNSLPQNIDSLALHELFFLVMNIYVHPFLKLKENTVQNFSILHIWADKHSLMKVMHPVIDHQTQC